MKKKLVYSLAALSTVPVAVNATAIDASTIDLLQSKWAGEGLNYDGAGTVIISPSGSPITQSIGTLEKGKYVFNYNLEETDGSNVIIEIAGQTKDLTATGAGEFEFTLDAQQDVTVKISSYYNKAFKIGAMSVKLRFDFDQAVLDLKKLVDDQLYVMQQYQNPVKDFYDLTDGGAVDQMIQQINAVAADPAKAYDVYKELKLWDLANSPVNEKIIDSAKKAAADENAYEIEQAQALLTSLETKKDAIDNLSDYSKDPLNDTYESIKKDIEKYIEEAQKATDNGDYPAYDINATTKSDYMKKKEGIEGEISSLSSAITSAQGDNTANDAANSALTTQLSNAQNGYTTNRNDLEEALSDAAYDQKYGDTEEKEKYDRYKQLLEDAITELDAQALILGNAKKDMDAAYAAGTSAVESAAIAAKISDANSEIDAIKTKYMNRLGKLDNALQQKINRQELLDTSLDSWSDVVEGMPDNAAGIQDVQKKINDLMTKIDTANDNSNPDTTTLEDLDITADLDAIDQAYNTLKTRADVDQENYQAWEDQTAAYNTLEGNYNTKKAEAEAMTYDQSLGTPRKPYDKFKRKFEDTSASSTVPSPLKWNLNTIKNDIAQYYANYFTNTYNAYRSSGPKYWDSSVNIAINGTQNDLNTTVAKLEQSTQRYNDIATAVASYNTKLNEVYEAVKDLDIYEQSVTYGSETIPDPTNPIEGATYKEKIATIQALIDNITEQVTTLWNNNNRLDANYADDLLAIAYNTTPGIIEKGQSLLDNYQTAQERFTQLQASIVLEQLIAAVQAQADDATSRLNAIDATAANAAPFDTDINTKKTDLNTQLGQINDDITAANAAAALATDTDLQDDVEAIAKLTEASEKLKQLVKNDDETVTDIEDLEKLFKDAKDNFNANKTLTTLWNQVKAALDQAKADAATEDPDAGNNYYQDPLLKGYEDDLNGYKTDIEGFNAAKTAKQNLNNYKRKLNTLKAKIVAVKQDVIDNLNSYQGYGTEGDADYIKGLQAYEEDVQKAFDEASFNIAAMDESSKRDDYQAELTGKKNELIQAIADIKADYDTGKANTNRQSWIDKLGQLLADINDIYQRQQDGYNEQIKADNDQTWADISAALDDAQNAFNDAVAELKKYKDMECEVLQGTLAKAQAQATALETTLASYPTVIDNMQKLRFDEYSSTTSPTVFDKQKQYKGQVEAITEQLINAKENFVSAIKNFIQTDVASTVNGYDDKVDDAKNVISTYSTNAKKDAFQDVETLIAKAKDYMNEPNLKDLDTTLKQLEDIDAMLKTDINNAADKDLGAWINTLKEEVTAGRAYLAAISDDNPNKQAWINQFEYEIDTDVEGEDNAIDLYDKNKEPETLSDVYSAIKAKYNSFHDNNQYYRVKNSDEWYQRVIASLDNAQTLVDNAMQYVEKFEVSGQIKKEKLNPIQEEINTRRKTAEERKLNGTAYYLSTYDPGYSIKQALSYYLYQYEGTQLLQDLKDLEQEFNRFAADVVTDPELQETVQGYKQQIDQWKAELDQNNYSSYYWNNYPNYADQTTQAENYLLPYEAKIAEMLTTINNANDPANAARLVKTLNDAVAELETKAATLDDEKYDQSVRDAAQADLDRAKAEIEKVKKVITDNADQIMFYKDKAELEIAAIDELLDNIIADAEAAQTAINDKIAANENANTALGEKLDELRTKVKNSKLEVDKYGNVKSDDFSNQYKLVSDRIEQEAADIAEKYAAVELTAASVVDPNVIAFVDARLLDIENTAANRDLVAIIENLEGQANAITIQESKYTIGIYKEMKEELKKIKGDQNIKGDIDILSDKVDESKGLDKSLADYVDQKSEADALQARIDALNKRLVDEVINTGTEPEPVPGDITGTGEVTDADFYQFLDNLLTGNLPKAGADNFDIYDANGDGEVNIGDLQAILNLSMGLNADGSDSSVASARTFDFDGFSAGNMSVQSQKMQNGNTRVSIMLDSTVDYRAFVMDVAMPANMSIVAMEADGLTLRSNELNGKTRIVGYGKVANGTMLTFEVQGDGNMQFTGVELATADAKAVSFNLGDATGISTIAVEQNSGNVIYDLGGKLMNGIKKGISIIRGKDGATKKVVR